MRVREFLVTLIEPDGTEYDITSRTLGDGDLTLHEEVEGTLTDLTHDDMDLELDDRDGFLRGLFEGIDPAEEWKVRVERQSATDLTAWDLLFVGVLDLPWSLQYHPRDKLVSMQVFSQSKLLERASAETIKRTFDAMTGTVTAGTATVAMNSTTNLYAGDKLRLSDAANSEERTIQSVNPGVSVTTTENWTSSFADAEATVTTPFYRFKSLTFLATELFAKAGISETELDLATAIAVEPFLSPISMDGLPVPAQDMRSIVQQAGDIVATMSSSPRKVATDSQSGFVSGAATTDALGDWRPYYDFGASEPGTIQAQAGASDNGAVAWDHVNARRYTLVVSGSYPNMSLYLYRNGSQIKLLDNGNKSYTQRSIEYWPGGGAGETEVLLISYRRQVNPSGVDNVLVQYDVNTTDVTTVGPALAIGKLRCVYAIKRMLFLNTNAGEVQMLQQSGSDWAVAETIEAPTDLSACSAWTVRALRWSATRIALLMVYTYGPNQRLIVWNWPERTVMSDTHLGVTSEAFVTVWTDSASQDYGIVFAGGALYILSRAFLGVIEYADFSGLSCGGALKELALMSGVYVTVSVHRVGQMRPRPALSVDDGARILDEEGEQPLDLERLPVWEDYRASIEVKYTRSDGTTGTIVVGHTGDSARRLSVSPKLTLTDSMALVMASALYGWAGSVRKEENGTWISPTLYLRPLDQCRFDGSPYRVIRVDTNVNSDEQEMRLVEITEVV